MYLILFCTLIQMDSYFPSHVSQITIQDAELEILESLKTIFPLFSFALTCAVCALNWRHFLCMRVRACGRQHA